MKRTLLILAMVACAMMLSCNPNDDDNNSGGENNNNSYEYVDLGLPSGLKWATCNIGADNPEDYGQYFAWGETSPKAEYSADNYQHWNDANGDGSWDYGELTINSDISGNASYDAATVIMGENWRIPTKAEQEELLNNCSWTWATQKGVSGYKVTGSNGNSIFLPAAGYYDGSSLYGVGEGGYYWGSTPNGNPYAYYLRFNNEGQCVSWSPRDCGTSIRPVSE